MPLIISVVNFETQYKYFYKMLSDNIIKLLRPEFSETDLVDLYKRINEMLCLKEALFPF